MPRTPAKVRQADIARAIRAAESCGKCTACCRGELIILHPDMGDDPGIYETQAATNPLTGRPALALKKNFMGDCIYLSRATGCTNYRNRPVMCRKFSCVGLLRATGEAALRQYAHIGVIDNDVIEAAKARISPSPSPEGT